jgi:hypothetical protein
MRNFSFESIYIYYEREEIVPSHSVLEAEQEKGGARNLPEKMDQAMDSETRAVDKISQEKDILLLQFLKLSTICFRLFAATV